MTKLSMGEAIAQGICRVDGNSGWAEAVHPAALGSVLKSFALGSSLTIACPREINALWFLRHAWSGSVEIEIEGDISSQSLFLDTSDHHHIVKIPPATATRSITIRSIPVEGCDPTRCEAWLLGFEVDAIPKALGRSTLLNQRTRLVRGDWGDFLVLSGDMLIAAALAKEGAWAASDIEIFRQHIREGDFVIDVGANFGHHSIVFSSLVGPNGNVLSVEAQRVMYQLVNANAVLNGARNMVPIHAAAGPERGTVTMYPISYDGEANFGALAINREDSENWEEQHGENVQQWTLDEIAESLFPGRKPSFIKIDVQAYELFVLQGMETILSSTRPTLFTEISPFWMAKAGYDYREIYRLLKAKGYEFHHTRPGLELRDGIPDVADGVDVEWDLLAIHPQRP
jgi:FkbM family methyltransferase